MDGQDELVVLWTSGDREVALEMVFMYVLNSKRNGWWDKVTMIVWGPSSPLLAKDEELQMMLSQMMDLDIVVNACKACADHYGVSDKLEKMGIEIKYMGKEFTEHLKSGAKVVTF
jgi:hypothetical protein